MHLNFKFRFFFSKIPSSELSLVNQSPVLVVITQHYTGTRPISGRVDRASATEAVDSGSIPGRVKPKTIKIGIHSFPAWHSALKGTVWSLHRVW